MFGEIDFTVSLMVTSSPWVLRPGERLLLEPGATWLDRQSTGACPAPGADSDNRFLLEECFVATRHFQTGAIRSLLLAHGSEHVLVDHLLLAK